MPASSRKRNKGKERKAKKEKIERAEAHEFWQTFRSNSTGCNHGCDVNISDDHPVSSFMDQFIINLKCMAVSEALSVMFTTHPHIYNNGSHRKLLIDIWTRSGTNMLLHETSPLTWPAGIAQSIVALEHYNGIDDIDSVMSERVTRSKASSDLHSDASSIKRDALKFLDSVFDSRVVCLKNKNLDSGVSSGRRDALKFYRKRVSCECLKKMHLEARKNTPKKGICFHCKEEKDRSTLLVCIRCMIYQYCSRECQAAAWPDHKRRCDEYVEANREEDE